MPPCACSGRACRSRKVTSLPPKPCKAPSTRSSALFTDRRLTGEILIRLVLSALLNCQLNEALLQPLCCRQMCRSSSSGVRGRPCFSRYSGLAQSTRSSPASFEQIRLLSGRMPRRMQRSSFSPTGSTNLSFREKSSLRPGFFFSSVLSSGAICRRSNATGAETLNVPTAEEVCSFISFLAWFLLPGGRRFALRDHAIVLLWELLPNAARPNPLPPANGRRRYGSSFGPAPRQRPLA